MGEVALASGFPAATSTSAHSGWRRSRTIARRAKPSERIEAGPRSERVAAFRLGLWAESRAAMLLIAKGYRIVARRWKTPFGEIDIIARRRRTLAFVEVKARMQVDDAAEAVTERTQRRIIAAAELWLAHHPDDAQRDIRFDVMLVLRPDAAAYCQRFRCQPLKSARLDRRRGRGGNCGDVGASPFKPDHAHALERRRTDGPDRADQRPRRFDFALLLEAQRRGHALSYYTPDRLALRDRKLTASVQPLQVRDQVGDHFTLGERRLVDLASMDVVLLRQDPPFDLAYITTTHCSSAFTRERSWSTIPPTSATPRRKYSSPNFPS